MQVVYPYRTNRACYYYQVPLKMRVRQHVFCRVHIFDTMVNARCVRHKGTIANRWLIVSIRIVQSVSNKWNPLPPRFGQTTPDRWILQLLTGRFYTGATAVLYPISLT